MRERRSFHRAIQPIEAKYRVQGNFSTTWAVGALVNISAGGMRFRAEELLDKNVLIEVEAKIPGAREVLTVKGMVIWSSLQASGVAEMGVQFSELTHQQQFHIDNLVNFLRSNATQRNPPPPAS